MRYNLQYRWYVGQAMVEAVWNHSTFSKNRERLPAHDVVDELFQTLVELARMRDLLSKEHFIVNGTLIQAWRLAEELSSEKLGQAAPRTGPRKHQPR